MASAPDLSTSTSTGPRSRKRHRVDRGRSDDRSHQGHLYAQALGKRLASGGVWAKDEVEKGFDSLGTALNQLGTLTPASANTEQPFAGSSR